MVVRLKNVIIEDKTETETKHVHLLQMVSKSENVTLTLEVPEVLSGSFQPQKQITITIDSSPFPKGESADFYAEGRIFRINQKDRFEVVGTIGGLRFNLSLLKPTPIQKKTFESDRFFISLST